MLCYWLGRDREMGGILEGFGGRMGLTMRNDRLERIIKEMVERIVHRFHPERIILFGSVARGESGPDSDLDLLVVMPVEGSRREKAVEVGVAVNDLPVSKDIIVTTPEDFEWRKELVGTIERPAAREGRLLYARP